MPIYDCGHPECDQCERAFGPDRSEAIAAHRARTWEELPLKNGEDGPDYGRYYAHYSHVGCPGWDYEDNCATPDGCAVRGRCRIIFERSGR